MFQPKTYQLLAALLCVLLLAPPFQADEATQSSNFSCQEVIQIPYSECISLVSIYNQLNGPEWIHRDGWLSTNTPCTSWYGVGCDAAGHVSSIDLPGNGLSGTIPTFLSNFTGLQRIVMNDNSLVGTIPKQIGDLSNLRELYLYRNGLTGEIPPELGKLTKLTQLDLEGNQLSGSIPPEIGHLTNLGGLIFRRQ